MRSIASIAHRGGPSLATRRRAQRMAKCQFTLRDQAEAAEIYRAMIGATRPVEERSERAIRFAKDKLENTRYAG